MEPKEEPRPSVPDDSKSASHPATPRRKMMQVTPRRSTRVRLPTPKSANTTPKPKKSILAVTFGKKFRLSLWPATPPRKTERGASNQAKTVVRNWTEGILGKKTTSRSGFERYF